MYSLDMTTGGEGYYIANGKTVGITWQMEEGGMIKFKNNDGEDLLINCGKTYIGLMKVSDRAGLNIQ